MPRVKSSFKTSSETPIPLMETSSAQKVLTERSLPSITGEIGEIVRSVTRTITRLTLWRLTRLTTTYKPNTFSVRTRAVVLSILVDDAPERAS